MANKVVPAEWPRGYAKALRACDADGDNSANQRALLKLAIKRGWSMADLSDLARLFGNGTRSERPGVSLLGLSLAIRLGAVLPPGSKPWDLHKS